ncbi:MAG: tetratricopeptide repeat protein [Acidobacteriota bacterium]|nr:tetratricopeptide repeat protein [Acidobacteriota bacterium]
MRLRALLLAPIASSLLLFPLLTCPPRAHAQAEAVSPEERAAFHRDPQWLVIAPHLPDPKTASAAQLEMAADVLRARRFPEDALDYYGYSIARGGPVSELLNKMGIVRLELHQTALAHELFQQTVRAKKKDASGWNNLGVTEYVDKRYNNAISDYRRAAKLDRRSAAFRSNLGMAYFENGDVESARKEFAAALVIDPHAFERRDSGGMTAQVVGTQNYSQLAFEMAKIYARRHDDAETLLWLAKATEAGFDTRHEMVQDVALRPYARDPRVLMMLKNAQQMKMRSVATTAPAKSLGPAGEERHID